MCDLCKGSLHAARVQKDRRCLPSVSRSKLRFSHPDLDLVVRLIGS